MFGEGAEAKPLDPGHYTTHETVGGATKGSGLSPNSSSNHITWRWVRVEFWVDMCKELGDGPEIYDAANRGPMN